jgi:hypothetical protein
MIQITAGNDFSQNIVLIFKLLNKEQSAEVSDTTKLHKSIPVCPKK